MHVRIPPVAPSVVDVLGETGVVEQLVWQALSCEARDSSGVTNPEPSPNEGVTGGQILNAKGSGRMFLDGALAALELKEGSALPTDELRYFLTALDKHGALLITLER